MLEQLLSKEIYHYNNEVNHDCKGVIDNHRQLTCYIHEKIEISVTYYKMDRKLIEHRNHFTLEKAHDFDECELRSKIQFIFLGKLRKIKFEYTAPSVQAILNKIPIAKVIDIKGDTKIIEVETFGAGINMFLLLQGKMVKFSILNL